MLTYKSYVIDSDKQRKSRCFDQKSPKNVQKRPFFVKYYVISRVSRRLEKRTLSRDRNQLEISRDFSRREISRANPISDSNLKRSTHKVKWDTGGHMCVCELCGFGGSIVVVYRYIKGGF